MPDINSGLALGELAGGIGRALQAKKQREYAEQTKQHDLVMSMVSAGLQSGTIKDPQAAFQFLIGGGSGKGKKGKDLPPMLQSLIGATGKLTGPGGGADPSKTLGGQDRPSPGGPSSSATGSGLPQFLSGAERDQQSTDADVNRAKRIDTEVTAPADARRSKERIAEIEARPQRGLADKQPTQNADGKWTIKVRNTDGSVVYEQPANAPKVTGPLGQRTQELIARGIPEDRASAVAAKQLQDERGVKQKQAATRLSAYLDASRASLLSSKERLAEMQQSFPYLLQARIAGADTADARSAITEYQAAFTEETFDTRKKELEARAEITRARADLVKATSDDQKRLIQARVKSAEDKLQKVGGAGDQNKRQAAAAKIVAAATKQAATLAGKENTILKALGWDDDEATIRRNLIQEMAGGADPDDVERQAKAAVSEPTKTAVPKDKDTPQRRIKARQYLQDQHLPVTPANIDHYLATAP